MGRQEMETSVSFLKCIALNSTYYVTLISTEIAQLAPCLTSILLFTLLFFIINIFRPIFAPFIPLINEVISLLIVQIC